MYVDREDWCIGYSRDDQYHYIMLIPTVIIRFTRPAKRAEGHDS